MKRRKYQQPHEAMDVGSPMLARHFTIIPKLSSPTTLAMKVLDSTEMDKLLMNDVLTSAEHGTLVTLAKRLEDCGFSDLRSPAYDSPIHADPSEVADKKADKIRGAVSLIAKMDNAMGRYNRKKIINLALYSAPWGDKRNQIEDLKHCIRKLDDIFTRR